MWFSTGPKPRTGVYHSAMVETGLLILQKCGEQRVFIFKKELAEKRLGPFTLSGGPIGYAEQGRRPRSRDLQLPRELLASGSALSASWLLRARWRGHLSTTSFRLERIQRNHSTENLVKGATLLFGRFKGATLLFDRAEKKTF
jgi:hypothetical protein